MRKPTSTIASAVIPAVAVPALAIALTLGLPALALVAQQRFALPGLFVLELRERIKSRYGLEVELKSADTTVEQYELLNNGPVYKTDPDLQAAHASCAFVMSFDFDAEEVWIGEDPRNATRPGVLSQGTYGPKANFKISLRELPDDGRFRITVTAAKYDDGLLLDRGAPPQPLDAKGSIVCPDLSQNS